MNIQALHENFIMPVKGSDAAGGYDIFMPTDGRVYPGSPKSLMVGLGFAAEVPPGHVALLLPRSGTGAKHGLALNNTCGVIDSDYRGEWKAALRVHDGEAFQWKAGERVLQFIIVPVASVTLNQVDTLSSTFRGVSGFGSTGVGVLQ